MIPRSAFYTLKVVVVVLVIVNLQQNAIQAAWESKLLPVSGLLTSGAQCSRDFRSTTQTSKQKYKLSKLAYSKSLMFDFTWYYHDFTIIMWVFYVAKAA